MDTELKQPESAKEAISEETAPKAPDETPKTGTGEAEAPQVAQVPTNGEVQAPSDQKEVKVDTEKEKHAGGERPLVVDGEVKEGAIHMPSPMGRPTKMDPLILQKLEQAFSFDASVPEACLYAGIGQATYYRWIDEKPDLRERFEALRETPILAARETVVKAIKTDKETARWYLERKKKKEFATRTEHTGAEGKDLIPLTDEQEAKIDRLANMGKLAPKTDDLSGTGRTA